MLIVCKLRIRNKFDVFDFAANCHYQSITPNSLSIKSYYGIRLQTYSIVIIDLNRLHIQENSILLKVTIIIENL